MKTTTSIVLSLLVLFLFSCNTEDDSIDLTQVQALLDQGETPSTLYEAGVPVENLYGKIYLDGILFHFNPNDGTGFVLSRNDLSTEAQWGCRGNDIDGLGNVLDHPSSTVEEETTSGALVGDGHANTEQIISACTEDNIAATICKELGPEWFLPSRGEFRLISQNLSSLGFDGLSSNTKYWTSSEYDPQNAWNASFGFGGGTAFKDQESPVRAIRAF